MIITSLQDSRSPVLSVPLFAQCGGAVAAASQTAHRFRWQQENEESQHVLPLQILNHNSLMGKCDIRPIWDQVYLEAFPVVVFEFFRFSNFLGGPEELEGDRVTSHNHTDDTVTPPFHGIAFFADGRAERRAFPDCHHRRCVGSAHDGVG